LIAGSGAKAAPQVRHRAKGWQSWPDGATQARGSCQRWGSPAGWRRRKERLSTPASLRSPQGCLRTPGPAAGGGSHNHSLGTDAAAPWSIHPRLLEVIGARTVQAFWEIKPRSLQSFLVWLVLPMGPGRMLPAKLGHAGPAAPAHVMPPSSQKLPRSSPAPCVGCRTERL